MGRAPSHPAYGGILEVSRQLGPQDSCYAVSREDVAVISPHVLVAKVVRRGGRDECEVPSKM